MEWSNFFCVTYMCTGPSPSINVNVTGAYGNSSSGWITRVSPTFNTAIGILILSLAPMVSTYFLPISNKNNNKFIKNDSKKCQNPSRAVKKAHFVHNGTGTLTSTTLNWPSLAVCPNKSWRMCKRSMLMPSS